MAADFTAGSVKLGGRFAARMIDREQLARLLTIARREGREEMTEQEARSTLANYLLGLDYRRLLYRAILSRYGTSQSHKVEHEKALQLFEAAFPEVRA